MDKMPENELFGTREFIHGDKKITLCLRSRIDFRDYTEAG